MGRTPLRRLLLALLFVAEFLGESSTTGMRLVAAAKESSSNSSNKGQKKKTSDGTSSINGPFSALHNRYQELSPKGRAIAGATVGFVGSRLALRTVTRVVKFGAAAFITYVHHNYCVRACRSGEPTDGPPPPAMGKRAGSDD
jgi:hypothetical protein